MDDKRFLDSVTIKADVVEEICVRDVVAQLEKTGVIVIRGLIQPEAIDTAKAKMRESFSIENDHPGVGEDPKLLYENYQKFSVNGGEFRNNAHPQCVRSFCNPPFAPDVFGMRSVFRTAARTRNLLMGVPLNWAIDAIEDTFWTASRVHHYPRGGGFMSAHCEDYVPQLYKGTKIENVYYQPIIVMSRKGATPDCDYESGGGYFTRGEEKCYFEEHLRIGDLIFYDTRLIHGVTEIDPRERFRQDNLEGRLTGLVTLYRDLT